jgi:ankyrin repeat protein
MSNDGYTAFSLACIGGHIEIVKLLLENPKHTTLNKKDNKGYTPLMCVCTTGNVEIVKLLLENPKFTSLNKKSNSLCTALMFASGNGHIDVVKLLLKYLKCININEKDNNNETAFIYAYYMQHYDIIREFLKYPNIDTKIYSELEYDYEIDNIIEIYRKNPNKVRSDLIIEDNIDIFYHIVFTSDNYFTIIENNNNESKFMKIVTKLPIELQMIIIYRLFGLSSSIISSKIFNDKIKSYIEKYLILA